MRLDGQEDVEGVGQSLEEEEKGVDPGAAWAVSADPALLLVRSVCHRRGRNLPK